MATLPKILYQLIAFVLSVLCALMVGGCTVAQAPRLIVTSTAAPTAANQNSPTPNYPATITTSKTPQAPALFRSPDGKWQAQVVVYSCSATPAENEMGYDELRIKNLDTGQEVLADSQIQFCGGLGAYGLEGFFWSKDSRRFYYTDARQGVPDGGGNWARPYLFFDTVSGNRNVVAAGITPTP